MRGYFAAIPVACGKISFVNASQLLGKDSLWDMVSSWDIGTDK